MNTIQTPNKARLATLKVLREEILPNHFNPVPQNEVLRDWFDTANIPRLKTNPSARRGGGAVYYSVSAVEKFIASRLMGKVGR